MMGFGRFNDWLDRLFPRGDDFAALLSEQARVVAIAVARSQTRLDDREPEGSDDDLGFPKVRALQLRSLEALNASFAAAFDREDIYRAIEDLTWIAEYVERGVVAMQALGVTPDDSLRALGRVLVEGVDLLAEAYEALRTDRRRALELASRAEGTDAIARSAYVKALAELLVPGVDPIDALRRREIYQNLADAATRVRRAAMVLSDMIVKDPA